MRTGGYKMSADGKSNSDENFVSKGVSSLAYSLRMSMENLRIKDDVGRQKRISTGLMG